MTDNKCITILPETPKNPIQLIGEMAGICWGSDTKDEKKNYKRGLNCIKSAHGRTFEFVDVYLHISGYSARVIREWYTHIGGSPTRLQQSTRYIDYTDFDYVIPPSIENNKSAKKIYMYTMNNIKDEVRRLEQEGIPREDIGLLLPLGMTSDIVCKHNLRNLTDMSRQRMCNRAYHEYRQLFNELTEKLRTYSDEWKTVVDMLFHSKCIELGYCPETKGCGKYPNKEV